MPRYLQKEPTLEQSFIYNEITAMTVDATVNYSFFRGCKRG